MSFLCTFLTFVAWGVADLFYKLGNVNNDKRSHLKTSIIVGFIMGLHASLYLVFKDVNISLMDLLKYLPVSLCYILSMVIGYKGLKYLELSICSPIQNSSGVITALLLLIFFNEKIGFIPIIAFILIFLGVILLSLIQLRQNKEERVEYRKNNSFKKILTLTIIFPLLYCIFDGMGTFLDAIYLDYGNFINEDTALIAYEYTFFVYAIFLYFYLMFKQDNLRIFDQKYKIFAAIFETVGQFFYVFAMSGNSVIAAPVVGSYCILSMLLSRIFLKEKLTKKEYLAIFLIIIGIIILGIFDI